jgi:hypothetical protein
MAQGPKRRSLAGGVADDRAYAAEARPEVFEVPICEVDTLAIERTFWEKATILHADHALQQRTS